jgi:hypothetical protein
MRIRIISVILIPLVMLSGCDSNNSLSNTDTKFTSWGNVGNQGKTMKPPFHLSGLPTIKKYELVKLEGNNAI